MRIFRSTRTTHKTAVKRREAIRFRPLGFDELEDRIVPATIVWNQTGAGPFTFSTGGNWQGGVAPGLNDIASFTNDITANQTINVTAPVNVQGIVLGDSNNTNAFTLSGSTITINS